MRTESGGNIMGGEVLYFVRANIYKAFLFILTPFGIITSFYFNKVYGLPFTENIFWFLWNFTLGCMVLRSLLDIEKKIELDQNEIRFQYYGEEINIKWNEIDRIIIREKGLLVGNAVIIKGDRIYFLDSYTKIRKIRVWWFKYGGMEPLLNINGKG